MRRKNMGHMKGTVTSLPRGGIRGQRLRRAPVDRPAPSPRRAGRAWINGREVGGPDWRFAHLAASYD